MTALTLKIGPIGSPETSVTNFSSMLFQNSEDLNVLLFDARGLKSVFMYTI
jgi:hypothetical protein